MKLQPIDYSRATLKDVEDRLNGNRQRVHAALLQHGPCTTAVLIERSGIPLTTVRPRMSELVQSGLVMLDEEASAAHTGREGVYRALNAEEIRSVFEDRQREALAAGTQQELMLKQD